MKQQQGFTLIELVIVIVILGILAAVAVPRFVDLSQEAEEAALQGIVGAVQSASSINYAAYKVNSSKGVALTGANNAAVCTTTNLGNILQGGWPNDYTVAAGTTELASGVAYCKITKTGTSYEQDDVQVLLTN